MVAASARLQACPHCRARHGESVLVCPKVKKVLPLEGRLLAGKFRLLSELGHGGMSTVWRAENTLVRRKVAIKLMLPELSANPVTLGRFRNEATSAGRIGNAHICDILDLGESDAGPFIVMELLSGRDLAGFIQQHGRLRPGLATLIMRQALEGLQAAHEAGIVHRDLKPENLFLHEPIEGRLQVKLMDFGISKFTEASVQNKTMTGVLMGTPAYMAPEQVEGASNVDARTDVWAMGAVMYAALTGKAPFSGATVGAILISVTERPHPPLAEIVPDINPRLASVVDRCLAKFPDDRFASARELHSALAEFEDETEAASESQPSSSSAGVPWQRPPALAGAGKGSAVSPPSSGAQPAESPSADALSPVAASASAASAAGHDHDPGQDQDSQLDVPTVPQSKGRSAGPQGAAQLAVVPVQVERSADREQGYGNSVGTVVGEKEGPSTAGHWTQTGSDTRYGDFEQVPGGQHPSKYEMLAHGSDGPRIHEVPERMSARRSGGAMKFVLAGVAAVVVAGLGWQFSNSMSGAETEPGTQDGVELAGGESPAGQGEEVHLATGTGTLAQGTGETADPLVVGATAAAGTSTGQSEELDSEASDSEDGTTSSGDDGETSVKPGETPKKNQTKKKSTKKKTNDPPPQIERNKLHATGGRYTPRTLAPSGNHDAAKRYCRELRRKTYAGLRQWQLASPQVILAFKGNRAIKRTMYWTRSRTTRAATAVNLFSGDTKQLPPDHASPRAFCVASR